MGRSLQMFPFSRMSKLLLRKAWSCACAYGAGSRLRAGESNGSSVVAVVIVRRSCISCASVIAPLHHYFRSVRKSVFSAASSGRFDFIHSNMGEAPELPSLPVPQLNKTLERYLASIKPVVSESQYERTRQVVEEFGKEKGAGEQWQQKLVDLSKTTENWATHFWLDDMYLNVRLPLPVNSSPFFLLPRQNFQSSSDQLRFAAKVVLFALDYKRKIDSKELKPDVARGRGKTYNLCMKTYENFFTAYRRPGEIKDKLITDTKQVTDNSMHIIVACRNQFYALYLPADDKPDEEDLTEKLKQITQFSKEREENYPPVGILTSEDRTVWAKLRDKLLKRNCEN